MRRGEYTTVTAVDHEQNRLTVERQDGREITYNPRDLMGVSVYRQAERDFSEGDRVQFTAPSKDLHVANRELGTIEHLDERGNIGIHTDSGRHLEFNLKDHPHLDYGYAVTSHSSQGQTADRVLIHVDTELGEQLVNERMAYVSVSRPRYDAHIYTNDQTELAHDLSREATHSTATSAEHEHEQSPALSTETTEHQLSEPTNALHHYQTHFHEERNHQGKGNMLLFPASTQAGDTGTVQCRERLGGLLKYYERGAA